MYQYINHHSVPVMLKSFEFLMKRRLEQSIESVKCRLSSMSNEMPMGICNAQKYAVIYVMFLLLFYILFFIFYILLYYFYFILLFIISPRTCPSASRRRLKCGWKSKCNGIAMPYLKTFRYMWIIMNQRVQKGPKGRNGIQCLVL